MYLTGYDRVVLAAMNPMIVLAVAVSVVSTCKPLIALMVRVVILFASVLVVVMAAAR